jgi:hypothetical protein
MQALFDIAKKGGLLKAGVKKIIKNMIISPAVTGRAKKLLCLPG